MLIMEQIRCPNCNRRLMDLSGHAQVKCPKCRSIVEIDTADRKIYVKNERQKTERQ